MLAMGDILCYYIYTRPPMGSDKGNPMKIELLSETKVYAFDKIVRFLSENPDIIMHPIVVRHAMLKEGRAPGQKTVDKYFDFYDIEIDNSNPMALIETQPLQRSAGLKQLHRKLFKDNFRDVTTHGLALGLGRDGFPNCNVAKIKMFFELYGMRCGIETGSRCRNILSRVHPITLIIEMINEAEGGELSMIDIENAIVDQCTIQIDKHHIPELYEIIKKEMSYYQ